MTKPGERPSLTPAELEAIRMQGTVHIKKPSEGERPVEDVPRIPDKSQPITEKDERKLAAIHEQNDRVQAEKLRDPALAAEHHAMRIEDAAHFLALMHKGGYDAGEIERVAREEAKKIAQAPGSADTDEGRLFKQLMSGMQAMLSQWNEKAEEKRRSREETKSDGAAAK